MCILIEDCNICNIVANSTGTGFANLCSVAAHIYIWCKSTGENEVAFNQPTHVYIIHSDVQ